MRYRNDKPKTSDLGLFSVNSRFELLETLRSDTIPHHLKGKVRRDLYKCKARASEAQVNDGSDNTDSFADRMTGSRM